VTTPAVVLIPREVGSHQTGAVAASAQRDRAEGPGKSQNARVCVSTRSSCNGRSAVQSDGYGVSVSDLPPRRSHFGDDVAATGEAPMTAVGRILLAADREESA
jgi:hypothetical protein